VPFLTELLITTTIRHYSLLVKKHYGWRGWTSEASASWRRFWRSGPQTPRQVSDEAAESIARVEAEAAALGAGTYEMSPDLYDSTLLDVGSDPLLNRLDKARRVKAGQQERARARQGKENRHRRG
jgi:hypothetical protein